MAATDSDVNVVSYARISADGERDEHGVKDQHRTNRETAKRYGWRVVAEFTDNDKSAAKKHVRRNDFEEMLKVLHSGRLADGTPVHSVVVRADDRLARRPSDYERFVDAITIEDGRGYADQQGRKDLYSDSAESKGLIGAVISKMEVRKMQRRMRNDHRRANEGMPPAGPRPFGWDGDRHTLDPAEAPHVRKAVEQFIAGRSINSIVAEWQRLDLKTPRGNQWTPSATVRAAHGLARNVTAGSRHTAHSSPTSGSGTPS